MEEKINFGIGFITGRPNVCSIINHYYKYIVDQVQETNQKVNITFYILYDLHYMNTKVEDFYKINPEVLENVEIKYLTPEYILEEREEVRQNYNLSEYEADLLIGTGYAKARNSILYQAVKDGMDCLLYWDDDEYPLAALRDGKELRWMKQKNVLQHLKNIENADITYGYRCGVLTPLPYIEYDDVITEEVHKQFIEAIENEAISWNKAQYMIKNESGIEYAKEDIAKGIAPCHELEAIGRKDFVLGSGICLNLNHLDKIPAFYNPPKARGEDTFFSCALATSGATVLRIPTYHFHDGFLKYRFLMDDKFPNKLRKITSKNDDIEARFKKATDGWTRYKPLLYYIWNKDTYREEMETAKEKLRNTAGKISTAFENCDLTGLINILEDYDQNVEKHYQEYLDTNIAWKKVKSQIMSKR